MIKYFIIATFFFGIGFFIRGFLEKKNKLDNYKRNSIK